MRWLKKIFISLSVLFFAVCCGAVLLFNWSALGFKALSVQTGSMRPSVPPGSLVLMHRVPISSLKTGDVITYANPRNPHTTITHRIIKTYKIDNKIPAFVTKGDANSSADMPVVGGQILGKAVWHVPHLGHWLDWSKTWVGLAILVYLPAFLIMFGEVQKMADYLRRFQPYYLTFEVRKRRMLGRKLAAASFSASLIILIFGAVAWPVQALLRSNTVSLTNNSISVAPNQGGGGTVISCTSSNNVNVSSNSNQTATTGSATVSGNTTGGSATSGSASNSNSSNTTIHITNC